jgi:predicted Zn finger-like uncharacterized protein
MSCPKCKAKIGVMKHEVILDAGIVQCTRCVICGYWSQPYSSNKRKFKTRLNETAM